MPDPTETAPTQPTPAMPSAKGGHAPAAPEAMADDEPSPEVVALFLRPVKAPTAQPATAAQTATPSPAAGSTADPVAVDASLIDSLTRLVTEALQDHVRESVTAAVRALAPRLVVSLPAEGAAGTTGDAQLRSRPSRFQKHR